MVTVLMFKRYLFFPRRYINKHYLKHAKTKIYTIKGFEKKKVSFSEKSEKFEKDGETGSSTSNSILKSVIVLSVVSCVTFLLPSSLLGTQNTSRIIAIKVMINVVLFHLLVHKRILFLKLSF